MGERIYSPGPQNVSKDFTKPTKSFKNKVVLAMLGIIVFGLVYLGLMFWFAYQSVFLFKLLRAGDLDYSGFVFLMAACFAVLSIFMFKSLLLFGKKQKPTYKEITSENEPELVDFIHCVAEETGAPKPKKIILTDRVNASVFYDLSLLNILIPTKKNLEIGVGLVNILNVTEFKAILAHEFGHFAQKSMLLGRYVYIAQQIAERIIFRRDALDKGLSILSSIDIRIAWIGWILSIIVWAIRSFIGILFSIVAVSERALSREMEFQADKVAVSVTGSDPLVYALNKLRAADEGYHAAIQTMDTLIGEKKAVPNMFILQMHYIEQMREVLDDPSYGQVPPEAEQNKDYRLFKNHLINPPEMWATHPSDLDREKNAKEEYIHAQIDRRPASNSFKDFNKTCIEVTQEVTARAEIETVLVTEAESIAAMDKQMFNWKFLNQKFKGVYLNRSPFQYFSKSEDILDIQLTQSIDESFELLYPDSIRQKLDLQRELQEEIGLLKNAMNEVRTAENRKVVHRGREIKRRQIPDIIEQLEIDELKIRQDIIVHDKLCRKVHHEAARKIGHGMAEVHTSLINLVHFAEHSNRVLQDENHRLQHALFVVQADGRITDSEIQLIIGKGKVLFDSMKNVYEDILKIDPDQALLKKMGIDDISDLMEPFKFESPNPSNIESWLNNYGGWLMVVTKGVEELKNCSLEYLLEVEDEIKLAYLHKSDAPMLKYTVVPVDYKRLVSGEEKELDVKLSFWDKFHSGIGFFPSVAKFTAAAFIIIAAIFAGRISPSYTLFIVNDLDIPVNVYVNNQKHLISEKQWHQFDINNEDIEMRTFTLQGQEIESFIGEVDWSHNQYVYNVANSAYLYQYSVSYGYDIGDIHTTVGPKRWIPTSADYVFETPPETIYVSNNGPAIRSVLEFLQYDPIDYPDMDLENLETIEMIRSHMKWDALRSVEMSSWVELAVATKYGKEILQQRIKNYPEDIFAHRRMQDEADGREKIAMNEYFADQYNRVGNPDFLYLKIRGMEDGPDQDKEFLNGFEKYPENVWLSMASGFVFARKEQWEKAQAAFKNIRKDKSINELYETLKLGIDRYCAEINDLPWPNIYDYRSQSVAYIAAIEKGDINELGSGINMFYHYLYTGDTEQAVLEFRNLSEKEQNKSVFYLAGSSNASAHYIQRATSIEVEEEFGLNVLSIAIGVYAANDKDYSDLLKLFCEARELSKDETLAAFKFIEEVKSHNSLSADEALNTFDIYNMKAIFHMIGCIILQDDAPKEWKIQVKTLLYPYEKPSFNYEVIES